MEPDYNFWVYIITNRTHTVLYIGMTNDLARRIGEHREGIGAGFPTAFNCKKLIYHEHYRHVQDALAREKQLKNWSRSKKVELIRRLNPNWNDLAADVLQDPFSATDSSTPLGMTKEESAPRAEPAIRELPSPTFRVMLTALSPNMPDRAYTVTIDPELQPGARNAIRDCLRLKPEERITIITDDVTREIAAALQKEVEEVGAEHAVFVIEEYAERPLTDMPEIILEDLAQSQVSIFCAQSQRGELRSRMQMSGIVNKQRIRHGHMVNISRQIMLEGMRADFRAIDALSQRLIERARMTERIKCRTPGGTDYEAEFSPNLKWLKTSGIITPDKWGNLPGGEIFTSPANSNGVFVVDGVVGDYLCQKYGDIQETPLTVEVENNRIRHLQCENKELLEEFRAYTSTDQNSNRVGEFAVGTNTACTRVIGNILQDEKIPGIHVAFGHPYSEHTGQNWVSKTHIDCVGRDFDIWFDDLKVMERGKFLV